MDYNEPFLTLNLSGLNYDTPEQNLPPDVWSAGQNIRFVDGATEKVGGHAQVFGTLSFDPNWFMPVGYGGNYYWIYADTVGVAVTNMTAHYTITPAAGVNGNISTNWNGCRINNYAVLNNAVDVPIWWNGNTASIMTALPAWPASTTAKVIRSYKNYLVAMNMTVSGTSYPDMIHWSDAAPTGAVPASWDHTDPTKDAGRVELADTMGEVLDGAPLGDAFIIYKPRSCYVMQFIGTQSIFKFRKLYGETGILAADCVVEFQNKHLVLTADDVVVHDGSPTPPQSILTKRMRSWLFDAISSTYYERSFVVAYHRKREIWVCVPTGASEFADTALIWNYETGAIGLRTLPSCRHGATGVVDAGGTATWDGDSGTWDSDPESWNSSLYSPTAYSVLLGDQTNSKLLEADSTNQFDGASFISYAERTSMPLLGRRHLKMVKRLYPDMTASGNPTVYFRVGSQMHPDDAIDWSAKTAFVIGTDDSVDLFKKGRYISVRCEDEDNIDWTLDGITLDIEKVEEY